MAIVAPKIDNRRIKNIIQQAESLAEKYLQLSPTEFEKFKSDETGQAIFQIFARLVQIILQRLNKVPDKNFLAFLDLVGVSLSPPKAARAPLNFTLAKGSLKHGLVPAGTQVATAQTEEQPAVVFETTKDMTVITSQLVKAFSVDPLNNRYEEHSQYLSGEKTGTFDVFTGNELIPHQLILGDDQIFGFKEASSITLQIETLEIALTDQKAFWESANLKWYYYDEDNNKKQISATISENDFKSTSVKITLSIGSKIKKYTIRGINKGINRIDSWTNNWIFAQFTTPILRNHLPLINTIAANISINRELESAINLDLAFTNNIPIDLSKDFYPFGEKPKFNDTFYIGSKEVFSKKGASVTLSIVLSSGLPTPDTTNIKLRWEFWDGIKWNPIAETTQAGVESEPFTDKTNAFTKAGSIEFNCPQIDLMKIQGEENYWIRVRIVDGDYGREAAYQEITVNGHYIVIIEKGIKYKIVNEKKNKLEAGEETEWNYIPATYKPPSICSFKLSYNYSPSVASNLQHCLTYNNFEYDEHILDNTNKYAPFRPFEAFKEIQPMIYLGFNQDISSLPITLYFSIVEKNVTATESPDVPADIPTLIWEYLNGEIWTKLDVEDATRYLSERELVQFLVPPNISSRYLFNLLDQKYFWIRIRIEGEASYNDPPQLRGIYVNTVWAYNRVTKRNEIVGSSNEKENQTFVLSQSPVFSGQQLIIKEVESPSGDEREEIISKEGLAAISEIYNTEGNLLEVWVGWHEVDTFYASGPHSRDYIIDHVTGSIRFGDGINGMIPPRGKDNVKCESYQFGGGSAGNVGAKNINELRTSIPYIDKVTNIEPAEGGANVETLDEVKERGPQTLKHRDRAVTWEDYEWLVKQASTAIARVKCISAKDSITAGNVKVIIVPDNPEEIMPFPSRALIRQVEDYLFQRSLASLTSTTTRHIQITGPGYIKVSIEAKVVPEDINQAPIVENRIRKNVSNFLHPLFGGPGGKGWDFGRDVFISEIYELIEGIEGVDHVIKIHLIPSMQISKLTLEKELSNIPAGSQVIGLSDSEPYVIIGVLADSIPSDSTTSTISVKGFQEMDEAYIKNGANFQLITIKSVENTILSVEPFNPLADFPIGSTISTKDNRIQSVITAPIVFDDSVLCEKVTVQEFTTQNKVTIISKTGMTYDGGKINNIDKVIKQVYIDENYLVYSGTHVINIVSS